MFRSSFVASVVALTFAVQTPVFAQLKTDMSAQGMLGHSSGLRSQLNQALADRSTVAELQKMGVSVAEAELRLAAMSDAELQQVAQGLDRQAGGDVITISVTTLLVILLIVLLVT